MPKARISKRDAALIRKFKIELRERQGKEKYPDPPYLASGEPTEAGLTLILMAAERGQTQNKIASTLGLGAKQFKKLLGEAASEKPTPARLAWEAGFATHESALLEYLTERAHEGDTNAALFLLRAVHERRDSGPQVQVDNSEKRITLVLPGSYSQEDYMKSIGQTEIIQAAPSKSTLTYQSRPNTADAELKDVAPTPLPAKLPTNPDHRTPLTPQNGYAVSPTFNKTTPY